MQDSIFTKIINGEVPCYKIYEDERTFAFLNINPVQPGSVLVVPREQVDHLEDLKIEDYLAVMTTAKKLMAHMRDELQCERIGLKVEGFEVPHAHVHLVPCDTAEDFNAVPYEATSDELTDMHQRLMY